MDEIILSSEPDSGVKPSLLEYDYAQVEELVEEIGEPSFRARQLWDWIYRRYAIDFGAMSNLPLALRSNLAEKLRILPLAPVAEVVSADRDTQKVLFQLADGHTVEAVLMVYDRRRTLCISSQAGCAMGCTFCATAQGGLARNLTVGEIVGQVIYFAHYLNDDTLGPAMDVARPAKVSNIVLMGMGEPLHNYDNVWHALRRLTDPSAFGLGARSITLSTVGIVPMIERMANEGLQINLAVSLHAPSDELRSQLAPINKAYPVARLLESVRHYTQITGRRVTFEYALMRGINDSAELANQLGEKLAPLLCHVNLIPLNPIPNSPFQPATDEDTIAFTQILRDHGVPATIRLRRGIEINAGCGQLQRALGDGAQGEVALGKRAVSARTIK